MCIICIELIKQKMTIKEAGSNLSELVNDRKETIEQLQHKLRLKEAIDMGDIEYLAEELEKGKDFEVDQG